MGEQPKPLRLRSGLAIVLGIAVAVLSPIPGPVGGPTGFALAQEVLQEYTLNSGDVVDIMVLGESTLSRTEAIRPDGKITLPLIGDVMAVGLSPSQLSDRISTALRLYLRAPQVAVSVREFQRAFVYLVGGGITRTGSVEIQRGWTVLEVLAAVGGVVPRAAMTRATLTRRGTGQTLPLDLDRLLVKGDRSANIPVEPGDIITVPVQQNRVLILGAVRTPGAHDLEEGARLLDGIAAAGGPLERSGTNNVGLIRNGADGKPAVTKVDLNKIMKGDLAQNMSLRQGDVVFIPQGPLVRWQEVLSWISGLTILRSVTSGSP